MNTAASTYRLKNPLEAWTKLAMNTSEMLMASAQVIAHRTNRMMFAGVMPNERDRREFTLMGQEKVEAAAESLQVFGWRMLDVSQQFGMLAFKQWMTVASGWVSLISSPTLAHSGKHQAKLMSDILSHSASASAEMGDAFAKTMHKGMLPIHSRATANAKRLARVKPH